MNCWGEGPENEMDHLIDADRELELPPEGHPLHKLGARLTELLDEDQWAACERLLLEGWAHDAIYRKTCANSRDFYKRRCEALQAVQDKMRDPERKAVCDILANGSTTALSGPVNRGHDYVQSKEHGGCAQCGYPEWEPWHRREPKEHQ